MELSHVGRSILLLGIWLRDSSLVGSSVQGGDACIHLESDEAGVPENSCWLGEGLVMNLNNSFGGRGWGRNSAEEFQGTLGAEMVQDPGEGQSLCS
jgi:hypothetical protein